MPYSFLADVVLLGHLAFILFVALGILVVWRFPRLARLHIPAAIWAGLIEITGYVCPLTPLENHLRDLSGQAGYHGSFVEHYLVPIIYPHDLSRNAQIFLGVAVIIFNTVGYLLMWRRARAHERSR